MFKCVKWQEQNPLKKIENVRYANPGSENSNMFEVTEHPQHLH